MYNKRVYEYNKRWREKNKVRISLQSRERYRKLADTDPAAMLHQRAKGRAAAYKIEFTITKEDIVVPTHCPVFNKPLKSYKTRCDDRPWAPSLDRIDSNKGYVKGNIQVISWRANNLKRNATVDELEAVAAFMRKTEASRLAVGVASKTTTSFDLSSTSDVVRR